MMVLFLLPSFGLARSAQPQQAYGYYSQGHLKNADQLSKATNDYYRIFTQRARGFGTTTLITQLEKVIKEMKALFPASEKLGVGDLSARNGGKITRHASHQNGLDVDLTYYRVDYREQPVGETDGFDESFVQKGKVTKNFDLERNWEFLKLIHKHMNIGRIFVDKAIKSAFCQYAQEQSELHETAEILRRLRPWPHHDNHLHIRIKCPKHQNHCRDQDDPPPGHGCSTLSSP